LTTHASFAILKSEAVNGGGIMPAVEERVFRLEAVVEEFVKNVGVEFNKLYNSQMRTEAELREFKEDIRQDRIETNRKWGELANKMGTLVEDMVIPNIGGIAKRYFKCEDFEFFASRVKKKNTKDRSKQREFDVIAVCDDRVIVNETKSTPRTNYIDDFIMVLNEFYDYFPEYKGKKLIPIFASLYLQDDVVKHLTKNGIYAMAIKEDTMDLLNYESIT
jgi:hypothetical protein